MVLVVAEAGQVVVGETSWLHRLCAAVADLVAAGEASRKMVEKIISHLQLCVLAAALEAVEAGQEVVGLASQQFQQCASVVAQAAVERQDHVAAAQVEEG